MCVFSYLPLVEYQNMHSISKGRTFLGCEDILASPHKFNDLFKVGTGLGVRVRGSA